MAIKGYTQSYLQSIVTEQPSKLVDLSKIDAEFLASVQYEAVDLKADTAFMTIFANYYKNKVHRDQQVKYNNNLHNGRICS